MKMYSCEHGSFTIVYQPNNNDNSCPVCILERGVNSLMEQNKILKEGIEDLQRRLDEKAQA
jgi:hypothetical protein